jgi:hypothetical protein
MTAARAGLEAAEADRAARIGVIEAQGRKLGEVENRSALLAAEVTQLRADLETAQRRAESLQSDNAELLDSVAKQNREAVRVHNELSKLKRQSLVRLLLWMGLVRP